MRQYERQTHSIVDNLQVRCDMSKMEQKDETNSATAFACQLLCQLLCVLFVVLVVLSGLLWTLSGVPLPNTPPGDDAHLRSAAFLSLRWAFSSAPSSPPPPFTF